MELGLMRPEEVELRELIDIVERDGEIIAVDTDPVRCEELRTLIREAEREEDEAYAHGVFDTCPR